METPSRRNLTWAGIGIIAFVVVVLLAVLITSCNGGDTGGELRAAPPPTDVTMSLEAQAVDTFTAVATWSPVVFQGDTIREYRRTITRTDTTQDLTDFIDTNASLQAIGSETFELPGPGEGETGTYRYCLRSVRADGVTGQDSTCASFQYTQPMTFPPPPDSLEVSSEQAVTIDSVRVVPDSVHLTFLTPGGKDSTTEVRKVYIEEYPITERTVTVDTVPTAQVHMAALLLSDGEVIGCDGDCSQFPLGAAGWDEGIPFYLAGRPGYKNEWVARRLPWLRQLRG